MSVVKLSTSVVRTISANYPDVVCHEPQDTTTVKCFKRHSLPMVISDNCLTAGKLQPIITKAEIAKCVINKITK